ncbi:hypothetical protein Sste5346_005263 [Sporothrix stenoceras]|uniref:Uncharacterized protein n=1 Tax=Sporothrix stenoceras TaxID=5173 RepID=A0ABR3Z496_9PEZI
MSFLRRLFRRKKPAPLVCSITLDDNGNPVGDDPNHQHTGACFVDFEPLALVELFQSQGCVSCPPAVPSIIKAATERPNRLLLTYNVTLFDHLGWKDTLASNGPGDQRQRAYVKRWGRNTLFTPQVVVNGLADASGAKGAGEVHETVDRARSGIQLPWHVYLDANDTELRIDSDAPGQHSHGHSHSHTTTETESTDGVPTTAAAAAPSTPVYDILVATYRSSDQNIKIGKGPNKGKKLPHHNAVIDITKAGQWQGGDLTVPLPVPKSAMHHGTEAVAFLQEGPGGPIIAAAKI